MRLHIFSCWFTMVFIFGGLCKRASAQISLVVNGTSKYQIVTPNVLDTNTRKAALDLQKYINLSTNAKLSIVKESSISKNMMSIFVGQTSNFAKQAEVSQIKDDGYMLKVMDRNIIIGGKSAKSTIYAVFDFLNRFVKVDFLTPKATITSKLNNIAIPKDLLLVSNPDFKLRDVYDNLTNNEYDANWYGINYMSRKPNDWGLSMHTFFKLIPPNQYFNSHPEYFSLVKNKRIASQLCLSNKDVQSIIIARLKELIKKDPQKIYWMVGQEDMGHFCQCDLCKKAYLRYGGYSGVLIHFINSIAINFKGKIIGTFAYHETLNPPTNSNIRPISNVLICIAPIQMYNNLPITAPINKAIASSIEGWSRISKNIMAWLYLGDFTNSLRPYPNLFTFQPNLQFLFKCGVKFIFFEDNNIPGISDLKELKTYVLSKLLWNSSLNVNILVKKFCDKYYGPASPYIIDYLKTLNYNSRNDKMRFFEGTSNYLNTKFLSDYDAILSKASTSVNNSPEYLRRVNEIRVCVDYCILKNNYVPEKSTKVNSSNKEIFGRIKRIKEYSDGSKNVWLKDNGKLLTIKKFLSSFMFQ